MFTVFCCFFGVDLGQSFLGFSEESWAGELGAYGSLGGWVGDGWLMS